MEDYYTELGDSWGGVCFEVPVENCDSFYRKNEDRFTPYGTNAYLKSVGIPAGFFKNQTTALQDALLVSNKANLREKADSLYVLAEKGSGSVVFASPATEAGWKDFSLLSEGEFSPDKWVNIYDDAGRGVIKYANIEAQEERDEYFPSSFLSFPVFYHKPVELELGLYKIYCTNGMIDKLNTTGIKVDATGFRPSALNMMVEGIKNVAEDLYENYNNFFDKLRNTSASLDDGRKHLVDMVGSSLISTNFKKKCDRHFDLIENGLELDDCSPEKIDSTYDVMDTCTYYAARMPSIKAHNRMEEGVFTHFYKWANGSGPFDTVDLQGLAERE